MTTRRKPGAPLAAAIFSSLLLTAAPAQEAGPLDATLQEALPLLSSFAQRLSEHDTLPGRKLFGRDQKVCRSEMDKLVNNAVLVLGGSAAQDLKFKIIECEAAISTKQDAIRAYREARLTAPAEPKWGLKIHELPGHITQKGYDAKIDRVQADIETLREGIADLKLQFSQQVQSMGIELTPSQANQLLVTVDGEDFVVLSAVYQNMKHIAEQLAELKNSCSDDIAAAKRYYGMDVALLEILDRAQDKFVAKIDNIYLPRLNQLAAQVDRLVKQAQQGGDESADPAIQAVFRENIKSNKITAEAIALYELHLAAQRQTISDANQKVETRKAAARNTYGTISKAQNVAALIGEVNEQYKALLSMTPPPLIVFESEQLAKEFSKLSQQIRLH